MTAATAPTRDTTSFDPFVVVGLTGILFAIVGGTELVTQIFPMALGSPEWEFGTYSSVMDSLPLLTMGMGFLAVYAVARNQPILGRVIGILFILLALFILGGAFLYATNVPQALRMSPRTPIQTGIKKAVAKAALQSTIYPIAFLWLGTFALRNTGRSRR
jgi:hypothetical protein